MAALEHPKSFVNPDWVQDMFGEDFVQAVSDRVTFAVQHFDGQVL